MTKGGEESVDCNKAGLGFGFGKEHFRATERSGCLMGSVLMGQGGVDSGLSGLKCVHLFGYRTTVQELVKHNTLQTNLLLSGGGAVVASMIVCDSASRPDRQMFTLRWCETDGVLEQGQIRFSSFAGDGGR